MGLFEKFKNALKRTSQPLSQGLQSLFKSSAKLNDKDIEALEEKLVEADVGVSTARKLISDVNLLIEKSPDPTRFNLSEGLRQALLSKLLKVHSPHPLSRPVTLLMVGVNGTGKTTTSGKLAAHFSKEGRKVLLVAADTFRAAAEEQLTEWAGRAKVEVLRGPTGSAPSTVVFDGLKSAFARGMDCVVVDTAGRLH